ncbi:MAG: aminotransferase class IV [Coriobacteriales bacterium]|jgi:4-amino-4-deoxychorismate lyase|nr:aminotransferase class IV [Coriobacteriales bacterium]
MNPKPIPKGAFETIAFFDLQPLLLDAHLRRLFATLEFLGVETRLAATDILACIKSSGMRSGVVRVSVSASSIDYSFRANPYEPKLYRRGMRIALCDSRRDQNDPLTYHKHLMREGDLELKRQAAAAGIDEPVLLNMNGEISEGAVSNIFIVTAEGAVLTPALECGLLPGTVREYLLARGDISEAYLRPDDLRQARAAFLTNAVMGVMPVASFEDAKYPPCKTIKLLRAYYSDLRPQYA